MKRKSESVESGAKKAKTTAADLAQLESNVLESVKNYNLLPPVIDELRAATKTNEIHRLSTGLLRIFGKLMKKGAMRKDKEMESKSKIAAWLVSQYEDYKQAVLNVLTTRSDDAGLIAAVTVVMKLIKSESQYMAPVEGEFFFPRDLFHKMLTSLLESTGEPEPAIEHLVEEYLERYDDLRFYYYQQVAEIAQETEQRKLVSDRLVDMLISISEFPESEDGMEFYLPIQKTKSSKATSPSKLTSHRQVFQKAWIQALRLPQTQDSYKAVMIVFHKRIVPRMQNPQLMLDFLTDAYNSGGSVSLLALNGLFSLMQKYNLDYPNFFTKLYALFDSSIMHVKYRSRFFRLVDLFLTSTHLPVTVAASFIKRMARLALYSPPSAIIAIIPFIYNQLKRHPTCMKMVHNEAVIDEYSDPYDNNETDPSKTGALDSSLWELETLQSHYHPNVAALARIMSQPFRKPKYPLEDFLDHSYKYLLDAEFGKKMKKAALEEYPVTLFGNNESEALICGFSA